MGQVTRKSTTSQRVREERKKCREDLTKEVSHGPQMGRVALIQERGEECGQEKEEPQKKMSLRDKQGCEEEEFQRRKGGEASHTS